MTRLSVGAIGARGHATRILQLVEASDVAEVTQVFDSRRRADHPRATERFEDLLGCDAVMVLSPSATHFDYLTKLRNYPGYVFCEKPPVKTLAELDALVELGLDPGRTFFDFNLRFSRLAAVIGEAQRDGSLGDLVAASAVVAHGLAFKPDYAASGRADAALHPLGIVEATAIHWIDLFITLFGAPVTTAYFPARISKVGSASDACRIILGFASGATADITASYASPNCTEAQLIGTNGIICFRDGRLEVLGPRDTIDIAGRFADPPVRRAEPYESEAIYGDSLAASVAAFLDACAKRTPFPADDFARSIASNRLVLTLDSHRGGA